MGETRERLPLKIHGDEGERERERDQENGKGETLPSVPCLLYVSCLRRRDKQA